MSLLPDPARQIASLPFAVMVLNPAGRIAAVNAAGQQLIGQGERRLLGKTLASVVEFGQPRLLAMMEDRDIQISARDVAVRLGKGRAGRFSIFVAPLAGWPDWQTITFIEAAEIDAIDSTLGARDDDAVLRAPEVLAHEIKNPLAGIRGAAQLLARKVRAKDRPLAVLIADEVDRIAKIIDQMQSLSSKSSQPRQSRNVHIAVRRARAVLEAAQSEPIRIVEEFDPSLPSALVHDDALVQVLLNLMTNAAEAARSAERPAIWLRTRFSSGIMLHVQDEQPPISLPIEIRVSDNGSGIDPALRDHIFEPFVSSKKKGQGLGLALVRKLVRDLGGRIIHERDEEAGLTHFRLHLSVAPKLESLPFADEPVEEVE